MKSWSWTLCALLAFGLVVHLDARHSCKDFSPPKPGDCPDFNSTSMVTSCKECSADSNCAGNEKCCRTGCGHQCVEPTFNNTLDKPGVCPRFKWSRFWGRCNTVDECSNDQNCTGDQKCCRKGCQRVCMTPYKPGSCPGFLWRWRWGNCANGCTDDFNCTGSQKCCRKGCKRMCMVPVKPGRCSRYSWHGPCTSSPQCSNDFDCTENKKCCRNRCGSVCMAPACRSFGHFWG